MNFRTAAEYKMPFGKYKGKTLDNIAATDTGLLYLDWLLGKRVTTKETPTKIIDVALLTYLSDNTIRSALKELIKD